MSNKQDSNESDSRRRLAGPSCWHYIDHFRTDPEDCCECDECLGKGYVWENDNGHEEDSQMTCSECQGSGIKGIPPYEVIRRLERKIDDGKGACEWWYDRTDKKEDNDKERAIASHVWMSLSSLEAKGEAMQRGTIIANVASEGQPGKEASHVE